MSSKDLDLEKERRAFDQQLPELMKDHQGEFVLFKDGRAVAFFPTYDAAYAAGLDRFGLDAEFLIQEVVEEQPKGCSISWEAGVSFG